MFKKWETLMKITEHTRVSKILAEYGDIADIMEMFGVKRVGGYGLRKILTKVITVKMAAKVHHVPLDKFLNKLNRAIEKKRT